jgi:undecaprenyl pyrophosphate synthase
MRWHERFLMRVVDSGEVPEHVAIIMDGTAAMRGSAAWRPRRRAIKKEPRSFGRLSSG